MKQNELRPRQDALTGRWIYKLMAILLPATALVVVVVLISAQELSRQGYDTLLSKPAGASASRGSPEPYFIHQPARDAKAPPDPSLVAEEDIDAQSHLYRHSDHVHGHTNTPGTSAGGKQKGQRRNYDPYCAQPQGKEESGVCAAWAAVIEYAQANSVARSALLLQSTSSIVSLIISLFEVVAIFVAGRAAELAAQSNRLAGALSASYLIPYVYNENGVYRAGVENIGGSRAELVRLALWCTDYHVVGQACLVPSAEDVGDRILGAGARLAVSDINDAKTAVIEATMVDLTGHRRSVTSIFERNDDGWCCVRQYEHGGLQI
ncbi:hypothetical protein [Sphingomonas sp. R1]|uniref:hypothetical protein n=1 Tax=Sphingomonas sp. R1 TaxID=399176 RepID=UPI002223FDF1|nr:hypothetical protein [Sphingomonas sp. R1]UYY76805.1 hypothetical protein OIM94_15025 [Sphingomonas sp. R1]